ncbi:MAG: SRPBCC family protein [Myxococcota bacterium]
MLNLPLTRAGLLTVLVACGASTSPESPRAATATARATEASAAIALADAQAALAALAVEEHTSAPARVVVRAKLDADVDTVWSYVSNHDNLVEYSNGVLTGADIDRSDSDGTNGVGAKRTCEAGDDRFVERIVYFRAPYVFAYQAVENTWGLAEHLAVVALEPTEDGGTLLSWTQHFDGPSPEATQMLTQNIDGMLEGRLLGFLTERFGGSVLRG